MSLASDAPGDRDADLVEALRQDDPNALDQLVERYGGRVYRLAMAITGVPEDAEDAAQHALGAAARRIHTFEGERAFGAWIDRLTAQTAYRTLQTRRPEPAEIAVADVMPAFDGDRRHFAPMVDWSDGIDEQALPGGLPGSLSQAIDALPADYRTALVLHDAEGTPTPEIAEILGLSVPAVKSRLHRARLFVRQHLSEYFASG